MLFSKNIHIIPAVFMCILTCSYSWAQSNGTISGSVYEEISKTPISKAFVVCYDYDTDEAVQDGIGITQDDGSYVIDIPPGNYRILVEIDTDTSISMLIPEYFDDEVHAYYAKKITVSTGQTINHIDFPLSVGGVIAGTVYDQNQNPIIHAKIEAYDENGVFKGYAHSLEDGSYYVHVPGGQYKILASTKDRDYVSIFYPNIPMAYLSDAKTITVNDEHVHGGYDFYLVKGVTVQGLVTNLNQEPLSAMRLWALQLLTSGIGYQYYSDVQVDGRFVIQLPPGYYIFYVEDLKKEYMDQFYMNAYDIMNATQAYVSHETELPAIDFTMLHFSDIIVMLQCLSAHQMPELHLKPLDINANNRLDMGDVLTIFQLMSLD
ncbi:MAG: carboxypeptidase regulatory-like domain-containing protein [Candidatus Magnetomorum sp.]|nr:carboxypeptidase regulatory-like domain-containing protein [Candidatus Magnetomorum sp.]